MTLRNEIFEGLAAAKAGQDIVKGFSKDPRDEYYRQKAEEARQKNEMDAENRRKAAAREAANPNAMNTGAPPMAGTGMPAGGFVVDNLAPGRQFRRGGPIRRYRTGGGVLPDPDPDTELAELRPEADDIIMEMLDVERNRSRRGLPMPNIKDKLPLPPRDSPTRLDPDDVREGEGRALQTSPPPASPPSPFGNRRFGGREFGASAERGSGPDAPLATHPAPTAPQPPTSRQIGGNKFGGLKTGGQTFGGQTFGGEKHGDSRDQDSGPDAPLATHPAPRPPTSRQIGGLKTGGLKTGGQTFGGEKHGASRDQDIGPDAPLATHPRPPPPPPPRTSNRRPPVNLAYDRDVAEVHSGPDAPLRAPPPVTPRGEYGAEIPPLREGQQPFPPDLTKPAISTGPPPLAPSKPRAPSMLDPSGGGKWGRGEPVTPEVAEATKPVGRNGPLTSGTSGPGMGNGAPAAPPAVTPARGALNDPNRIDAFDPRTERGAGFVDADGRDLRGMNPGAPPAMGDATNGMNGSGSKQVTNLPSSGMTGGQADQGMSSNNVNQDVLMQALSGALSVSGHQPGAPPPFVGHKAASRETLQRVVQAYSTPDVSPGSAMLRGMLSMFQSLLSQGRVKEANEMAYGVIQAANLEMASYGEMAIRQMRAGNNPAAARAVIEGVDWAPDGLTHMLGSDGKSIMSVDGTGKVTGRAPIDGRWILAAANGLRDGTMLWKTLEASAAQLSKEKNPEGKALLNLMRREQIENIRLRNKKLSGGMALGVPDTIDERAKQILAPDRDDGSTVKQHPVVETSELDSSGGQDTGLWRDDDG